MPVNRRTTIWLGDTERGAGDAGDFEVRSEDDMVAITAEDGNGDEVEVFICFNLFRSVRHVMDSLERE
jgi:hypothetical protein